MNTMKRRIAGCSVLFAVLWTVQTASAWYAPGLQRWINRDPIGELGFESIHRAQEFSDEQKTVAVSDAIVGAGEGVNLYAYVHNTPLNEIDPLGLVSLPPGWHGPGKPYDPSSNPFCKPPPPCFKEAARAAAASAIAVFFCARASRACVLALTAAGFATDEWAKCMKKSGLL